MAKNIEEYICQDCGFKSPKWMGRCTGCGSWNSFKKEEKNKTNLAVENDITIKATPINQIKAPDNARLPTGIGELDRVLGGGIVSGSLILLGGAPGIGKSTLILQVAFLFSKLYGNVLYVSAEESARQLKLRAERLHALTDDIFVLSETEYTKIEKILYRNDDFKLVIIDSIQTVFDPGNESGPGSISQVKGITNQLLKYAKSKEIPVVLIGHVTKKGELAGPRVLEHLVDTVLHLEGDRNHIYRILRSAKNRFGSTDEIGVFSMEESGIKEVQNPSQIFLQEKQEAAGSVIVPVLEGSRIILVEVQALVSTAAFSAPQRVTTGLDSKRISILLAVLEKKAGFSFQNQDVYLNITGGFRVQEPAIDLAIIISIISSYREIPVPSGFAVVGEVGLAGEIRAVSRLEKRIEEVKKMNFTHILVPSGNMKKINSLTDIKIKSVSSINKVLDLLF